MNSAKRRRMGWLLMARVTTGMASVGELIDSGVEARAKTSATVLGDNGHIAEIPVGHWSEHE
jgi:hypothetical protein